MPTNLAVVPGSSRLRSGEGLENLTQPSETTEWRFKSWGQAFEAFSRGGNVPKPRFLVLVNTCCECSDSPLTVSMVQKLAHLAVQPTVRRVNRTDRHGSTDYGEAHVIEISWDEMKLLKARTFFEDVFVLFTDTHSVDAALNISIKIISINSDWERRPWVPWAPEIWAVVMEAYARMGATSSIGFPVIVEGLPEQSTINGAEALQQLLGLSTTPILTKSRLTRFAGDWSGDVVMVADIDLCELNLLQRVAELEERFVWFPDASLQRPLPRVSSVVKSIQKKPIPDDNVRWRHWGRDDSTRVEEESMREVLYPVIISKPHASATITFERLRKLAELPPTHEPIKTTITKSYYGFDGVEVEIAAINAAQLDLLGERTECVQEDHVWLKNERTGKSRVRSAYFVKTVRDKWLESLEWEESVERGEAVSDDGSSSSDQL